MVTTTIEATGQYKFKYDPESPEFKVASDSYKAAVDGRGGEREMIIHCAHNIRQFGLSSMVEGIGYVKREGRDVKEPWSGITIEDDDPDFYYDDPL